jgi:hypothetical protein
VALTVRRAASHRRDVRILVVVQRRRRSSRRE